MEEVTSEELKLERQPDRRAFLMETAASAEAVADCGAGSETSRERAGVRGGESWEGQRTGRLDMDFEEPLA